MLDFSYHHVLEFCGQQLSAAHEDTPNESSSLLGPGRNTGTSDEQQVKIVKGLLYAAQVFYSFFIM
jgi:copper transporter 1